MNKTLKVGMTPYPPFVICNETEESADGIEVLIVKEMACCMNLTVKFLVFNNWGTLTDNGSWAEDGLGSAVTKEEVDLAIGFVPQNFILYKTIDFGPSLTRTKTVFAVQRPEQIEVQWEVVLKIFHSCVWLFTLAAFVLVVVINKKIIDINSNSSKQRWQQSVMTMLGIFLSTSTPDRTKRTRCLLTVWSVFCLLLTTCLSSGIFSKLTLPSYTARVDTLQQLVEQGYYWTSQVFKRINTTAARDYLFNKNNTWARQYLDKYRVMNVEDVNCSTDRKITFPLKIEGGDLVVIDPDDGGGFCSRNLSQFRMSEEAIVESHSAFGLKKQLPDLLAQSLAVTVVRFQEVGLIQHWKSDVLRRYPEFDTRDLLEEHDVPVFKGPEPLPLSKLRPLFYLLFAGYVAATCAFIVEYFPNMFYKAKQ